MTVPIYYIRNGILSFADKTIFDELELYIYPGDRVCLIGRNGCGKTSLMKVISGEYELDKGEIYQDSKTSCSYLSQESVIVKNTDLYQFVLGSDYDEAEKYQADVILEKLQIDKNVLPEHMSGGQVKRLMLARALVSAPDLLLLDEPTNHLDIAAIEWLEEYLNQYKGAVICISHDKVFLNNISNKVWWLDRAVLRKSERGFKYFDEWQEEILRYEEATFRKLDKKLGEENIWLSQGVTARRKRNQKRLADLKALRVQMRTHKAHMARNNRKIIVDEIDSNKKAKFIIKAEELSYSVGSKTLIKDFNLEIQKGEKIGIIGPNGVGKTTLIQLLLGKIAPDAGRVRHGKTLEVTYFDQNRSELNPNHTLQQTLCPGGGDQVFLPDRVLHVAAYLKNFLFDPKLAFAKVGTLSGGERGRLLLAKSLINPGNLLVLDEPTNDLDMDSLETLLELLSEYKGTLLLVSHDRGFLDSLVTRTLVFTPTGQVIDFIGGYEDYQAYFQNNQSPKQTAKSAKPAAQTQAKSTPPARSKLSYHLIRKLETIPLEVEKLELQIAIYEQQLDNSELYIKDPEKFQELTHAYNQARHQLEALQIEWIEIDELHKATIS